MLFGIKLANVKYASLRKDIDDDNKRVNGKIRTKSFESSCSFFGINFNFISLAIIHFDFTIIFKNVTRYELNISKKDIEINLYFFSILG